MPEKYKELIRNAALTQGFDAVAFTSVSSIAEAGEQLLAFLGKGYHGSMDWLSETAERRKNPRNLWDEAQSAVILGMNYGPEQNPLASLAKRTRGAISVYARNHDYHEVIKKKLRILAHLTAQITEADVKIFVDTAPLMEKPLAQAAGIGWQGKHSNLVSRDFGSWLFLGVILTRAYLDPDQAEKDHCGTCRACLDICPTSAFPQPYVLDARRCISYLTIEYKGHIPLEFRPLMGNRIYGCDDCLAVCPWNKFARQTKELQLRPRAELNDPPLAELALFSETEFRRFFTKSPIKRIGRNRFIRNLLIAIGNSQDSALLPCAKQHLHDESPLVRAMAVWAVSQLLEGKDFSLLRYVYLPKETDSYTISEWKRIA